MSRQRFVSIASALVLVAALATPGHAAAGSGPGVDLTLSMSGPADTPKRGTTFTVTLEASNAGTETARDVTVSAYIADPVVFKSYSSSAALMTCSTGEYGALTCSLPELAGGARARVTLTLERTGSRETWIDAWISSPTSETNWENNSAWIYLEPDRSNPADVRVSMTSPLQPEVGERFPYTSTVANAGPEVARNVSFNQSISELSEFVSVKSSDPTDTCELFEQTYEDEGEGGAPYTYREVRCELGDMTFAEQATITVEVIRKDPHQMWSSAWVSTDSYDARYENDWADASTAGHPSVTSDLRLAITGADSLALVGADLSYTLTVTNAGPASVSDAVLDTWLPEQLALRSVTPSRAGDVCEQDAYQGISCKLGNLAAGETAEVVVDATRVGARELWLGGSVWSSNYDPDFESNYVERQMGPDPSTPADLAVTMSGPKDPAVGSNFDYVIEVTNNGPREATSVKLNASVPEGTEFVSVSSPDSSDACSLFEETFEEPSGKFDEGASSPYMYREVRCSLGTLVPAETATVTVTLTRTHEYEMWGSAWVSTASYDENYDNDYASFGSFGEPVPGCGATVDADGRFAVCDTAGRSSGGGDSYGVSSEPGKRVLMGGEGNDTITVRIPSHSKEHRLVVVKGGTGRDKIKLLVDPGAGNVTVLLKGGRGRDTLEAFVPRAGRHFELRMWGGRGSDTCTSVKGDRHRSRAC